MYVIYNYIRVNTQYTYICKSYIHNYLPNYIIIYICIYTYMSYIIIYMNTHTHTPIHISREGEIAECQQARWAWREGAAPPRTYPQQVVEERGPRGRCRSPAVRPRWRTPRGSTCFPGAASEEAPGPEWPLALARAHEGTHEILEVAEWAGESRERAALPDY